MILISHRGNTNGPMESWENEPTYIDLAIRKGYDVEVDVWFVKDQLFLGHDKPQYGVSCGWFNDRLTKLWIHCKNVDAIVFFKSFECELNYFWHETDTITLTSKNHIWAYPGKQKIDGSIAVMPELCGDDIGRCYGICSDYVDMYKTNLN